MRINSIHLKNFRIHSKLEVEFSRGMNLLLGKNGAGKSSILEAIGVVLFGSKPRNNGNNSDVIKFGENEAFVEIEFTGNDDEIYVVEFIQKLTKREWKLYRKIEPTEILRDGEEIQSKLKALVGIDGELKNIYDNIIVAKQNEFINIYKGTEKDRQVIFDKIFETEIYRTIHDKFSKDMMDRYTREAAGMEVRLDTLGGKVENPKLIEGELSEKESLKKDISERVAAERDLEKKLSAELDHRKKTAEKLTAFTGEKTIAENSHSSGLKQLADLNNSIAEAEKSHAVVEEEKDGYLKYQDLIKQIEESKLKLETLKKDKKNYDAALMAEKELEKKIAEVEGSSRAFEVEKNGRTGEIEKILQEIEKLSAKKSECLQGIENLDGEMRTLQPIIKRGEELVKKLDAAHENLKSAKFKFESSEELMEIKNRELTETGDIHELKKNSEKLKTLKRERDQEREKITTQKALLNQSIESEKELSTGLCPYLKESCKNLQGRDIREYFQQQKEELTFKIEASEKNLDLLAAQILSLEDADRKIERYTLIEKEMERISLEKESNFNRVESCELEIRKNEFEVEKFQREYASLEELKRRAVEIETEKKALDLPSLETEILGKSSDLKILETKVRGILENIQKLSHEGRIYEAKREAQKEILENLKDSAEILQEAERGITLLEEELKGFKRSHDLYIQNVQRASKLDELKGKKIELELSIAEFKNRISTLESALSEEQKILNLLRGSQMIEADQRAVKEKIQEITKELGAVENSISELQRRLKSALETSKEISELESKLKKLRKKIELTKLFRENVRNMGEEVASRIIERISHFATENFRKITGRSDSLCWSNKDSNGKNQAYSVVLEGMDSSGKVRKVNFGELSGGEQVAVAISIRGAMSNLFTKTRFSIFDEPTNNLDLERRKSLAENIGEILVDLDQSIIVTHDDTFREMAQKVIEL